MQCVSAAMAGVLADHPNKRTLQHAFRKVCNSRHDRRLPCRVHPQRSGTNTGGPSVDLVSHELSVAGKEGIQVRVDFDAGAFASKHTHPGEEIAYVLRGSLEYQLGDQPPVRLKAGESLFIPAGTPHSARNVGSGQASELATYIVTKGANLVVPAK